MSETVINFVIQIGSGENWTNVAIESDETLANTQYNSWAQSKAVREGRSGIRMIRRVAIITDKVIKENGNG